MRQTDLAKLRQWRTRPDRDITIAGAIAAETAHIDRQHRQQARSGDAWTELAPPRLRPAACILSILRGTLTLRARDAAARFEIDRWLRNGNETPLLRRSGARRIRVVLG